MKAMKPKKKPTRRSHNHLTGQKLFQRYLEQPAEQLPQFLASLSWEDVQAIGKEMTKQVKEARDAGDTDVVLNLVSRSMPFLEYFEEKS
jgi:hypothetical protein